MVEEGGQDSKPLLANALRRHEQGSVAEAERLCLEVLGREPENAQALYLLGTLKARQEDPAAAAAYLRDATRRDPSISGAWVNLGNVLFQLGEYEAAETAFHRILESSPTLAEAWFGLGQIGLARKRYPEARRCLGKALEYRPDDARAMFKYGQARYYQGDLQGAVTSYRDALSNDPGLVHIHSELGKVLQRLGRLDESVAAYRQYVKACPDAADGWNNLGLVQRQLARMSAAAESFRHALSINPGLAETWNNLGNILKTLGQPGEAIACYRHAISLRPGFVQAHSNLLLCLNYLPSMDEGSIFKEHLQWAARHVPVSKTPARHANVPDPDRKLHIGYVSPDLRSHAVARFFEPLLASHDHEVVTVTCYAQVAHGDATTRRLQAYSDAWCRTVGMPDEALARRIRADGIDILVDLAGHTARNRLPVFGLRPAPVQLSWLGYPNTTGMTAIDYRLSDRIADPEGAEAFYTEELVRMEGGLSCYLPPAAAPAPGPLPALERGCITFGSLNNLVKLNEAVISLWSRVLRSVPGSRLLLFRDMLKGGVESWVRSAFARQGIGGRRLDVRHSLPGGQDYLSVYRSIDIALDPFPWNGHVTTCEALWMGVPVITLLGPVHRGRLAASVLHQVGLDEFVAAGRNDYIRLAGRVAGDRERLADLRGGLRARVLASGLCEGRNPAREVEAIYRRIWRRWCSGGRTEDTG